MPAVEIIREPIGLEHLRVLAGGLFGDLVKAVVDVDRGIMVIAGELHADENVRPRQGNRTRSIDDPEIRRTIATIVEGLVTP